MLPAAAIPALLLGGVGLPAVGVVLTAWSLLSSPDLQGHAPAWLLSAQESLPQAPRNLALLFWTPFLGSG